MNVSIVFHLPCKKVVVWDAFLSNFARTEIGARAAKIEPPRMPLRSPTLDGCVVSKLLTNYTRTFEKDWNMAKVQHNEKLKLIKHVSLLKFLVVFKLRFKLIWLFLPNRCYSLRKQI